MHPTSNGCKKQELRTRKNHSAIFHDPHTYTTPSIIGQVDNLAGALMGEMKTVPHIARYIADTAINQLNNHGDDFNDAFFSRKNMNTGWKKDRIEKKYIYLRARL